MAVLDTTIHDYCIQRRCFWMARSSPAMEQRFREFLNRSKKPRHPILQPVYCDRRRRPVRFSR